MHSEDALPDQYIVFDREYAPAPFYLHLKTSTGADHVELLDANGPAQSLPAAVQICVRDGYDPAHYVEVSKGRSALRAIPASVVRRPASPARSRER